MRWQSDARSAVPARQANYGGSSADHDQQAFQKRQIAAWRVIALWVQPGHGRQRPGQRQHQAADPQGKTLLAALVSREQRPDNIQGKGQQRPAQQVAAAARQR